MSSRSSPRCSVNTTERERLEHERTLIRDGLLRNMKTGDCRYLIPAEWYNQWKKFVGMGGYAHSRGDPNLYPGRIDLSTLIDENGRLKRDLVEMRDYRALPGDSWKILLDHYGIAEKSPPSIYKHVIMVRNKENSLVEVVELYPLKIAVRPLWDLGHVLHVECSRSVSLDKVNSWLRKSYDIPEEAESRLWHKVDSSNAVELIDSAKLPTLTLQNICVDDGSLLFMFETRQSATDHWPSSAPEFAREAVETLGFNAVFSLANAPGTSKLQNQSSAPGE